MPLPTSIHSAPFLFSLIFQRQLHEVRGTMTQVPVQLMDLYLQMTFTLCHHRKTISATEREMILMNLSRHLTQHYCANCINCSLTNPTTTGSIRNGDMCCNEDVCQIQRKANHLKLRNQKSMLHRSANIRTVCTHYYEHYLDFFSRNEHQSS